MERSEARKPSPFAWIVKPMAVTGKQLLTTLPVVGRKPSTILYPYERPDERDFLRMGPVRGQHEIDWEKCIGCASCARACPNQCIYMERITFEDKENPFESSRGKMDEVKKSVKRPAVDVGHCLFCGLCSEVCPTDAWQFTKNVELADLTRKDLYYSAQELRPEHEENAGVLVNKFQEYPILEVDTCIGCMRCDKECPTRCIHMIPGPNLRRDKPILIPDFDYDLCIGCESCVEVCPVNCLIMEEM